jgi:hypothetical protein
MIEWITGCMWGRRLATGFLAWLVPFLISILFFGKDGNLLIDQMLFKSLMIVAGSITAAILMVWYFSFIAGSYAREAVLLSGVWLLMNWALDIVVMIEVLGMPPGTTLPGSDCATL